MLPLPQINAVRCHYVKNVLNNFCASRVFANVPSIDEDVKNILTYNCNDFIFPCEYNAPLESCTSQVDYDGFIKVSSVSKLCPYTISPYFPRIILRKNMFTHKVILPLSLYSTCGEDDTSVEGIGEFKVYTFARIRNIIEQNPNGFFTRIKLYTSSTDSVLFDISPLSAPFWSTCPTCVAINPLNLSFSSPYLAQELSKVLKNIGRYLYSSDTETSLEVVNVDPVIFGPKAIEFRTDIKHLGTNILAINPADFEIHYDAGTLTSTSTTYQFPLFFNDKGVNHTAIPVFPSNFSIPIGYSNFNFNLSPTNPISGSLINLLASTVNEIVLFNGGISSTNVKVTPSNVNYVEHILTAQHNVPPTLVHKGWYDAANNLLTTSDVYITTQSGTYTFKIQSSSLPLITKTVTV